MGAVRVGDYKLKEYFEDNQLALYNLREDIRERNNLAESLPEKRDELHRILKRWREDVNAPVPTEPNPKFDAVAERQAIEDALAQQGDGRR